jgi:hypothetical protein
LGTFLETDENFQPQMFVRADLTRYAPGGNCMLWMDGAKSTIREFRNGDVIELPSVIGGIQHESVVV